MYHDMTKQHQYRLLDGAAIIRPATLTDMQSLALVAPQITTTPTQDTADSLDEQEQAEEEV